MIEIGVLISHRDNVVEAIKNVHDHGFTACQLSSWGPQRWTDEEAEKIRAALDTYHVKISTFWCGWSGPKVWDQYDGPLTLGIVPLAYRHQRMEELKKGADFAKKLGVKNVATHAGFIPETPNTEAYRSVVCCLRDIAKHLKDNGQYFLFETGQETPVTLRRAIQDIGLDNLGVNLDPANLLLYGKANPVDALDILGEYIRDIHGKDGNYPQSGYELGHEQPLGQGSVNYPAFIAKLKAMGYDGPLTIEREISGEQQLQDILAARELLTSLINND